MAHEKALNHGLPVNEVWGLSIIFAVSSLIGGGVFEILVYEWDIYKADPLEMLRIWNGGVAAMGSFSGPWRAYFSFVLYTNEKYLLLLMNLLSPPHCFWPWDNSAIISMVKSMGIQRASGGQ